MEPRDSFVFYRSFYESIKELEPKDRDAVFLAVCNYALNGDLPNLTGVPAAIFVLVRPNIDANTKRYENGKSGGRKSSKDGKSDNQGATKSEPNGNQDETKEADSSEKKKPNVDVDVDVNADVDADADADVDVDGDAGALSRSSPATAAAERQRAPFARLMEAYNGVCVSLPSIVGIDGGRKKAVAARWRTYGDFAVFQTVFQKAEASTFLKGGGASNWVADFDWLMNPTNIAKVLEGKYDDKQPPQQAKSPGEADQRSREDWERVRAFMAREREKNQAQEQVPEASL